MSEPALKCENNAIFKQNYTLELFISLKMAISCCFGLRGNLEFPDFLQIKFYNINYWKKCEEDDALSIPILGLFVLCKL